MATKLDKQVEASDEKMLFKSHKPLITWANQVTLRIKNVISPFPRDLWPLN